MSDRDKSAYGKLCTLIYDLDKPLADKQEIDSFIEHISSASGRILEAMCGSGRFLIPMLKEGYCVSGFDSSAEMLKACSERCRELDLHPRLFTADVTDFNCDEKYDHVFITAGSASLLTTIEELSNAFRCIFNCLAPGGNFIFTYVNRGSREDTDSDWKEVMSYPLGRGVISCMEKVTCHASLRTVIYEYLYEVSENGIITGSEYQKLALRTYEFSELYTALHDCGFRNISEAEGCGPGSECGMVICRK
ncbi:MAG: class I SAM-dependent methyltransferase [Ignavibacteria bacterium]|nr:class I SAM-dependent methyltransferase [Ignavibacteria bacterium]